TFGCEDFEDWFAFGEAFDTGVSEALDECESKLERSQPHSGEHLAFVFFRSSFGRYSYRPSVGSRKSNPQSVSPKAKFSPAWSMFSLLNFI
ncbi:MAG: hypothetical protein WCS96_06940, partial [Victivallales bacterium]